MSTNANGLNVSVLIDLKLFSLQGHPGPMGPVGPPGQDGDKVRNLTYSEMGSAPSIHLIPGTLKSRSA